MKPWIKIIIGLIFSFLTTAIIVGYQGIFIKLRQSSIYLNECIKSNNNTMDCSDVEAQLEFMFIITVSLINVISIPAGIAVGKYGPRIACSFGSLISMSGSIIFALSTSIIEWTIGYILIGIAGTFIMFSMLPLSNLIKTKEGLILSLLIAAVDASSVNMYILGMFDSIKIAFLAYTICPFGLLIASQFIFTVPIPSTLSKNLINKNDFDDYIERDNDTDEIIEEKAWFDVENLSLSNILISYPFLCCCLWMSIFVTAKYFYIMTLDEQLRWIGNGENGTEIFSIMLPCAGIFAPLSGYILDKKDKIKKVNIGLIYSVILMSIMEILIGILSCIKIYNLQYITMVLLIFNRFMFFATAPFALGKLYGNKGKESLYGFVVTFAGLINLTNYFWKNISVKNNNWIYTNIILHC